MKKKKAILLTILFLALIGAGAVMLWNAISPSNPWNAATVGDIPVPRGYKRVTEAKGSYTAFMRDLPLKGKGCKVKLYTGGNANYQWLSAAVVDIPLLSNSEQCADMTMRLRAEWLFSQGRYSEISFQTVNGKTLWYHGGANRKALNKYLRKAYGQCSTYSVFNETQPINIKDVRPGDVFVYKARKFEGMGHAVIVVDVARKGNKTALLIAEGNTPARSCHILRNPNPLHNPWFFFDGEETAYQISVFRFGKNELRRYN